MKPQLRRFLRKIAFRLTVVVLLGVPLMTGSTPAYAGYIMDALPPSGNPPPNYTPPADPDWGFYQAYYTRGGFLVYKVGGTQTSQIKTPSCTVGNSRQSMGISQNKSYAIHYYWSNPNNTPPPATVEVTSTWLGGISATASGDATSQISLLVQNAYCSAAVDANCSAIPAVLTLPPGMRVSSSATDLGGIARSGAGGRTVTVRGAVYPPALEISTQITYPTPDQTHFSRTVSDDYNFTNAQMVVGQRNFYTNMVVRHVNFTDQSVTPRASNVSYVEAYSTSTASGFAMALASFTW